MKLWLIAALLFCVPANCLAGDCRVIDHGDRIEAICEGDKATAPDIKTIKQKVAPRAEEDIHAVKARVDQEQENAKVEAAEARRLANEENARKDIEGRSTGLVDINGNAIMKEGSIFRRKIK